LFQLLDERIVTQNKIIEDLKKLKSATSFRDTLTHSSVNSGNLKWGTLRTFLSLLSIAIVVIIL
jgi:hypothetical protein